jgi:YYY domain-containing protein
VLLLILTAALLTLAPEFVYLRDNFGARMNTIFKFYYQAWVMFGVASAYALYAILQRQGALRWVAGIGAVAFIGAGLVYPVLAVPTKTNRFAGEPTLDGMAYMAQTQPADHAAILWLQENESGTPVILEAVGGQYTWGGRISAHTGLPTVLGWAGHELQWRGSTPEPGIREPDVETLYTSRVWSETEALLDKYGIEYVVAGPLELSTYGHVTAVKFDRALDTVFETDGARIYRWNGLTP